jgi:hypothetical protein
MRRFTVCEMLSHFNNDPPHKIPLLSHSGMVLVQNITNRFSESWKSLILQRIIFLVLTDFVVDKLGENLSGMEARKSATLWSDEQHRSRASFAIPWESPYLRAVCE